MLLRLAKRFILSEQGIINLLTGSLACAFYDFTLMLQSGLIYSFSMFMLITCISGEKFSDENGLFYLGACLACAMLLLLASWFQYNTTFLSGCKEAATRRLILVEKLGSHCKDHPEIMNDCAVLDNICSHFLAQLIGAIIFAVFMAFPMLYINWIISLAALCVIPIAFYLASLKNFMASSSSLVLRSGLALTLLAGAVLSVSLPRLILFIVSASRLYDILEVPLQNIPAIINSEESARRIRDIII